MATIVSVWLILGVLFASVYCVKCKSQAVKKYTVALPMILAWPGVILFSMLYSAGRFVKPCQKAKKLNKINSEKIKQSA
jgi:hypothetical protein